MTMATTTIRIDIATLPDHLDRSRPNVVATIATETTVAWLLTQAVTMGQIRADGAKFRTASAPPKALILSAASSSASKHSSAPIRLAPASFAGLRSTATIVAPVSLAIWMPYCPKLPQPRMTASLPGASPAFITPS